IRAHVVETRVHLENARSTIYAISLAFGEPQELCYQLVRYASAIKERPSATGRRGWRTSTGPLDPLRKATEQSNKAAGTSSGLVIRSIVSERAA
ncbi:uncharacterized protein METZ01_LOCUS482215, partial [marine metagenome]